MIARFRPCRLHAYPSHAIEQTMNMRFSFSIDAFFGGSSAHAPAPCFGDLADVCFAAFTEAAIAPSGRAVRFDGWTPARTLVFLSRLGQCGIVEQAARAAGVSKQGAYARRARLKGRAFDRAWSAALSWVSHSRLAARSPGVFHGRITPIFRRGRLWGERHHVDNRLDMAVLTGLDRHCRPGADDEAIRCATENFDAFVKFAAAGDVDAALAFIAAQCEPICGDQECASLPPAHFVNLNGQNEENGEGLEDQLPQVAVGGTVSSAARQDQLVAGARPTLGVTSRRGGLKDRPIRAMRTIRRSVHRGALFQIDIHAGTRRRPDFRTHYASQARAPPFARPQA